MAYDVTVTQLPLQALFDLNGDSEAVRSWCGKALPGLPTRPNSFTESQGRMLQWIGLGHWILRADIAQEEELLTALKPGDAPTNLSVVLISDTLTFFAVTGPDIDQVMAVATTLDFSRLAADDVTMTEIFGIKAMVRRIAQGYELVIDRSYDVMIAEYLDLVRN